MTYTQIQSEALGYYLRQYKVTEISDVLDIAPRTIHQWVSRFKWKEMREDAPVELMTRQRIAHLLWIDEKCEAQLNELHMLLALKDKRDRETAREQQRENSPNQRGGNTSKKLGRPSNKVKNDTSGITREMLREYFDKKYFQYQKEIHDHKHNAQINHIRFYLKSRQIGLTDYFSFEALEDAILTGENQVFISASRKQAEIFKNYIRKFALEIGGVDLKGKDSIILSNGAELHFMSTNVMSSQGFNGHMYYDEVFWMPRFKMLDDYAGGMSIHSNYRTTYLSTPSSTGHEAYPKWTGAKEGNIDISHQALKNGSLGADYIFRQVITVDDAIKKGATFFDLEKLHRKYPVKTVFDNLLRCVFLDDAFSFFSIKALIACKVDTSLWADVAFDALHPVGIAEVLVGYDPRGGGQSENSDDAGLIVALKPKRKGGVFRCIERLRLKGSSYEEQSRVIEGICKKYNVVYLAIDVGGVGSCVAELVRKFYPALTRLDYSPEMKRIMAYKAREIINAGRLQFDEEWDDVVHSFLMIRQHTTAKSNQITFISTRSKVGSHADLAWAAMHILHWEPIDILRDDTTTVNFF
ncbi:terminase [Psychromonas sp. PRT-SC03]|nr:terminase [Psychromonas sp. PRT-SC03]